ncbi:ATP synthase protein I [Tistlia consotensis]|uniref:ATP synthase protein I n=1 Tax=Tistlia consotensis USBA 355 TaxID=560819 RepID=A0A1Y6CX95_9PROT|nr:AtpZ/AtpI family protein [Tistlia consotensis]SMF81284.1 ATP synthase protein I [Tistlia consotensis USBA 355]SNS23029.1 ATP synthase protein I [Tistlia consotensis]
MAGEKRRDEEDFDLAGPVRERRKLDAFGRRHGERSIGQNIAMIGALGWLIVTPTLAGLFLGRLLDHRFGTGISWSAGLLFLGVVAGGWLAWRRMHQP